MLIYFDIFAVEIYGVRTWLCGQSPEYASNNISNSISRAPCKSGTEIELFTSVVLPRLPFCLPCLFVLLRVSIVVIEHHDKVQLGGGSDLFISQLSIYHSEKSEQEYKAGIWRQEMKKRPWKNTVYFLALRCMLNLLSKIMQDHLSRGSETHSGLGPLTLLIKKMHFRLAYRPILWQSMKVF